MCRVSGGWSHEKPIRDFDRCGHITRFRRTDVRQNHAMHPHRPELTNHFHATNHSHPELLEPFQWIPEIFVLGRTQCHYLPARSDNL